MAYGSKLNAVNPINDIKGYNVKLNRLVFNNSVSCDSHVLNLTRAS